MSPTVLRLRGYRLYFFSREESRRHVHIAYARGEAKIWLEPDVEVAYSDGLSPLRLQAAVTIVEDHRHEIWKAWNRHFGG